MGTRQHRQANQRIKGRRAAKFRQKIDDVALVLATEAGQPVGMVADLDKRLAAGREAIVKDFSCIDCHKFHNEGELGNAPDLTGYASREWLTAFISNPADERFYSDKNDRMPAFAAHPNDPTANRLSPQELSLLVSWLRGEWYEPAVPINPPGKSTNPVTIAACYRCCFDSDWSLKRPARAGAPPRDSSAKSCQIVTVSRAPRRYQKRSATGGYLRCGQASCWQ